MNRIEYLGHWATDAPLSERQVEADKAVLSALQVPEAVTLVDATVYVDGHEWHWRSERVGRFR